MIYKYKNIIGIDNKELSNLSIIPPRSHIILPESFTLANLLPASNPKTYKLSANGFIILSSALAPVVLSNWVSCTI